MPVRFDHCPNVAYRNHPEVAASVKSSVLSAVFVPSEDDASNGDLGKAAVSDTDPVVYVVSDWRTHHGTGPGIHYSIDVTLDDQFYRIIMKEQSGKLWKMAVEVRALARTWIRGKPCASKDLGLLARARWKNGFHHTVNTITNKITGASDSTGTGNEAFYQVVSTKMEADSGARTTTTPARLRSSGFPSLKVRTTAKSGIATPIVICRRSPIRPLVLSRLIILASIISSSMKRLAALWTLSLSPS